MQIFQLSHTEKPDSLHQYCMNAVKNMYGKDYHLEIQPDIKVSRDSEQYKVEYLLTHPDALYLDWDMIPLKDIRECKFQSNKLYVYGDRYDHGYGCEGVAIYCNGCTDFLEELNIRRIKECIHTPIRERLAEVRFIPEGYFLHLELSKMLNDKLYKNNRCRIIKNDEEEFEFEWIKGYLNN